MTKAGEKAIIQYLGVISTMLTGDLAIKTSLPISNVKETADHIKDIYQDYLKDVKND